MTRWATIPARPLNIWGRRTSGLPVRRCSEADGRDLGQFESERRHQLGTRGMICLGCFRGLRNWTVQKREVWRPECLDRDVHSGTFLKHMRARLIYNNDLPPVWKLLEFGVGMILSSLSAASPFRSAIVAQVLSRWLSRCPLRRASPSLLPTLRPCLLLLRPLSVHLMPPWLSYQRESSTNSCRLPQSEQSITHLDRRAGFAPLEKGRAPLTEALQSPSEPVA